MHRAPVFLVRPLTKFRWTSSLEKLHSHGTSFPAWEHAFPREKRSLTPENAKFRAWERRSHAFQSNLTSDNSVHVQRTSAEKTLATWQATIDSTFKSRAAVSGTAKVVGSITVSHGSAYTVVKATQQVNGKWQFWQCQNSVTPEPID